MRRLPSALASLLLLATPLHAAGEARASAPVHAAERLADPLTWWRIDRLPDGDLPPPPPEAVLAGGSRREDFLVDLPIVPPDAGAGAPIEQVVVTSDALAAAFQRYADEESRRGVPTLVRTTSWIDTRYPGTDSPARIRTFLRDAYVRWGAKYAVLGGDVEHVPTRYVPWGSEEIPTDLYFECLDREWNEDGDAIYGEPMTAAVHDGYVVDVARATDGRLWVATYFGVAVLDGPTFESWDAGDGLPAGEVLCIAAAPDGSVWAGTTNGVARWDGAQWRAWGVADGLPALGVTCIDAAGEDDAWVGTGGGLAHWDGVGWTTYTQADGLPHASVTCVARDGPAIWVGTPAGLARREGGAIEVFHATGSGLLSDWIQAVAVDPQGRVWAGHADNYFSQGGLSIYNEGAWTADALTAWDGPSVRGFAFDGAAAWMATSRGAIRRETGGDTLYDESAGLPADDVYDLVLAGADIALATPGGLAVGPPEDWAVYGVAQGLPRAPLDYDDIDWTSEILVGRIPATDVAEVDIYLDKLEAYRRGIGADHADRVLALGENLFTVGDGRSHAEAALSRFPAGYARTELYEVEGTQDRATTLAALDEGPGWVVAISHGSYDVLGAGPGSQLLFNRDIDATSPGGRAAFVLIYSCNSGAFDFESTAEHLLFHPAGGAIAMVSNVREGIPSVDAGINERFLELLFASDGTLPAAALRAVRREHALLESPSLRAETWRRRTHLTRSFLGSPTVAPWRTPPRSLTVAHPAQVTIARGPFEVVVTDALTGDPVAGARVCISKGSEDWARGATGPAGRVVFDFDAESVGAVDIVVDAPNFRLWTGQAEVVAASGPHLAGEGVEMLPHDPDDPGREMVFRLGLRNTGSASTGGWTLELASEATEVRVLEGTGVLGPLGQGEIAWAGPFRVLAHASVADGAAFTVRLSGAGAEPFRETFRVVARRPTLHIAGVRLDGDTILAIVENVGSTPTGSLRTTLRSVDGAAVIEDGISLSGALAPGERREFTDDALRATGPASAALELRVDDGRGGQAVLLFDREAPPDIGAVAAEPAEGGARISWPPAPAADLVGYRVLQRDEGGPWRDALAGGLVTVSTADVAIPPGGTQQFAVVAVDRGGLESPSRSLVTAHAPLRPLAGWPRQLSSAVGPSPVVAVDVDGDGQREIMLGSMWDANAVHLLRTDGEEWFDGDANPRTHGIFGVTQGRVHSAPLAHDIDGDGRSEIFAVSFDGYLYGWRVDDVAGAVALPGWPVLLATQGARSGPVAADVDADGDAEIVTFALDGVVRVHETNGAMAAGWPKATRLNGVGSTPAVADLDGDAREDIAFGGTDSSLYVVSGTGADFPGFPVLLQSRVLASPVLADIDSDGDPEIFVMTRDGRVHGYHHEDRDGAPGADAIAGWPVALEVFENAPPSPAVADFDGDGVPEIVVPARNYVAILRADGSDLPGWPRSVGGQPVNSPVVADLDGDGALDLLIGTYDRRLRALRQDGTSLPGWPRVLHERPWSTPYVADVDADGWLDVVIGSDDLLVRVESTPSAAVAGAAPWPGYQGGVGARGLYVAPPAAAAPLAGRLEIADAIFQFGPVRPNPFHGATTLRFTLPVAGRAKVSVYDVSGRRVATLLDRRLEPGSHELRWDGRNEAGAVVGSGVYFLELQAPPGRLTTRALRVF